MSARRPSSSLLRQLAQAVGAAALIIALSAAEGRAEPRDSAAAEAPATHPAPPRKAKPQHRGAARKPAPAKSAPADSPLALPMPSPGEIAALPPPVLTTPPSPAPRGGDGSSVQKPELRPVLREDRQPDWTRDNEALRNKRFELQLRTPF